MIDFWRRVYHLSGLTLLDNTKEMTREQKQLFRLVFETIPVRFPFYQAYVIAQLL